MNCADDESKILVISHNSFSMHSNNGKTLTSIFSGWKSQNIAQLYFQEEIPESVIFHNFYRIRDLDVAKRLLGLSGANVCGEMMLPSAKVVSHYSTAGWLKIFVLNIFRKFNNIKLVFRDLLYGTGLWRSNSLMNWLGDFLPDSVFFVGGNSVFSFVIANFIADLRNIPLDVYITDDYVVNSKPRGVLAARLHDRLFKVYRETFNRARYVFVIGDDMAVEFKKVFGRDFIPLMNSVSIPASIPRGDFSLNRTGCVDIVYAGGLHLGRDKSLADFAAVIRDISAITGLDVKLTVYSCQTPCSQAIRRFNESGVIFGGSLDQEQVQKRFMQADFVLHVESFDERYVNLTKLSVSTKIPEYLSSGACVIAYGPSELASIRILEKNGLGICLTENSSLTEIREKLTNAFFSDSLRETLACNGFDFAKARFDSVVTRDKIKKLLN